MVPVFLIGGYLISTCRGGDRRPTWRRCGAPPPPAPRSPTNATRAGQAAARARRSTCRYGDVQVLFDVDLEVDEGEIVALLGTNGAGKSTLLKAICGAGRRPTAARSIFDGRDITRRPAARDRRPRRRAGARRPGRVPVAHRAREPAASPAGCIARTSAAVAEAHRAEVLELFPVLRERTRRPGGRTCRAASSRCWRSGMAFLSRPRLLLIDELSLGLAPVGRRAAAARSSRELTRAGHHRSSSSSSR